MASVTVERIDKWGHVIKEPHPVEDAARFLWRWRDRLVIPAAGLTTTTTAVIVTGSRLFALLACSVTSGILWITGAHSRLSTKASADRRLRRYEKRMRKGTSYPLEFREITPTNHADELVCEVGNGADPADLIKERGRIGNVLKADVHVRQTAPHQLSIRVQRDDILSRPVEWEHLEGVTPDRIPAGIDWNGERIDLDLAGRSLLVTGVTGSGKSAFLSGIVARFIPMEAREGGLIDPLEGVDFGVWHPYFKVAHTVHEGMSMLRQWEQDRQERLAELRNAGIEKAVWPDWTLRLHIIDEISEFTTAIDYQVKKEALHLLTTLASKGRKTLDILIAATQYPTVTVIPEVIRNNFTNVIGLKAMHKANTDVVFGGGAIAAGWDLSAIPLEQRGRGLLDDGSGVLRPGRFYGLFGEQRRLVAEKLADYNDQSLHGASTPEDSGAPLQGGVASLPGPKGPRVDRCIREAGPKGIRSKDGAAQLGMAERTFIYHAKDYAVFQTRGERRWCWVHRSYLRRGVS